VVLVEKGDFGSGTTANNQKIIHGGLRYLQHGDLQRMRESIRERRTLMRIAPHLVSPLPFVLPTYGYGMRSKAVVALAMLLNDLISVDRNWHGDPQKRIPRCHVLSKKACLQLVPGLEDARLTGGALWFDGQVHHPERLTLAFLSSAVEKGAEIANYARVVGFLNDKQHLRGVRVCDELTHKTVDIVAKIVVNTSGPWINQVLHLLQDKQPEIMRFCKAVVLVTRQIVPQIAFGVYGKSAYQDADALLNKGSRLFFVTPWRNVSLVGTFYVRAEANPDAQKMAEEDIHDFLGEINAAYPASSLKREDVYDVYQGLLPVTEETPGGDVQVAKQYRIVDHAARDGLQGLISVVGVKFTTARDVAEKTVNLVLKKLACPSVPCLTAETGLVGGRVERFDDFRHQAIANTPEGLDRVTIVHLVNHYGTNYAELLTLIRENPEFGQRICPNLPVLKAEIVYAVQQEMAVNVTDIIYRRTVLASNGLPELCCLQNCIRFMARQLGWNEAKMQQEIAMCTPSYRTSQGEYCDAGGA
jgi:glycerol-3-phosphate dehydrogenase